MEELRVVVIYLCFIITLSGVLCNQEIEVSNPECKPHKVIVPVGSRHHDKYFFIPSAVEIYRCMGPHIGNEGCAIIEQELIEVTVTKKYRASGSKENVNFFYANHTQCAMRCSCSPRQRIRCQGTDKYEIPCPGGYYWDFDSCKCKSSSVGCSGRNTGNDHDEVFISRKMFIVSIGATCAFFILVIFCIYISKKCNEDQKDDATDNNHNDSSN